MKVIELVIIILYAVAMLVIGFVYRKKAASSVSGFWSAEANVPIVVNAFCLLATVMSGGGMMGNIGLAAATGVAYILCANLGSGSGLGMGAIFVAKPLKKSGAKTLPQFLQIRYPHRGVALLTPLVVIIAYTLYLVAQMKASGTVGEYILGVDFNVALVITWIIFTVYVMTGGMLAVTWTDFFQGCLMMLVTVASAITTLIYFGGYTNLMQTATGFYENMGAIHLPLSSYAGFFFLWVFIGLCSPHILMRVGTTKSPFAASISMHGGMLLITVFSILTSIVLGMGSRAVLGATEIANKDAAFLYLIDTIFGPFWRGLTGAAIYAAIMSTAAGLLLAAAAALSNDIIARVRPMTEKQQTRMGSICVVIISCIVLSLSFNPPEFVVILYSQAMALMVSCLMIPMLAGIWWRRATPRGALFAIIGGGLAYAFLFFGLDLPTFSEIFIAVPISLVSMLVGSYTSEKPSDETIAMVESWHKEDYQTETNA
jgi:sodium/pantothenate symporter